MMLSVGAFAQQSAGTITIQPKVGMNVANYASSEDSNPRVGLAAGAEFEYQISKLLSVSAGVMYSMQGAKHSSNFNIPFQQSIKTTTTWKTDYINIPIVANVYVFKGLALKVGVQPGFNVLAKALRTTEGVETSASLSDLGIDVQAFDFAIPVGLSYEYKNIVLDARYNIGVVKFAELKNIPLDARNNIGGLQFAEHLDYRNRVFQITLGYKSRL